MTTQHPSALDRIRATFQDLDAWGQRIRVPLIPAALSDLDGDDAEGVSWHTSQLSAAGLASARNHLHAIRLHIEAREMFAEVTGTLIRGAVLGAAQTVWLLAPDDREERLRRSRLLTFEVLSNQKKFLDDLLLISPDHEGTQKVSEHVKQRLDQLRAVRQAHREQEKFSSTQVIEEATAVVFGQDNAVEGRVEWRRFSGNAHGLPWAILGLAGTEKTSEPDTFGMASFSAGGSFDDVLNGFMLAHGLSRRGWSLLDQRSANVQASQA